jgi:hypothetical protein
MTIDYSSSLQTFLIAGEAEKIEPTSDYFRLHRVKNRRTGSAVFNDYLVLYNVNTVHLRSISLAPPLKKGEKKALKVPRPKGDLGGSPSTRIRS